MTMADTAIGQNGSIRQFRKGNLANTYNGRKNHVISAPRPRWQRKPIDVPTQSSLPKAEIPKNLAYFKNAPIVHPKSAVCRPLMAMCCESCTPLSKATHMDKVTECLGLWNMLRVPESNPDRNLWSRAFCHLLHVYRVPAHSQFTVVPVDKILSNNEVMVAVEATVEMEQKSTTTASSLALLEKQKRRIKKIVFNLRTIMSTAVLRITAWMLYKILPCLLKSVQIHKGKLDYIRRFSGVHPVLFVPLHHSHLDYFLLTFILYDAGVRVPYIAAGDNLNIPFIGWFLRRVGAFYIRRKYEIDCDQKDLVYRSVLETYVNYLLKHKENIGFFIEGGRSRSGKPQNPKGGILRLIVDACKKGLVEDVVLVPVGISYEKIIDTGYVDELLGKPKIMETTWGALRGFIRALCGNYGNVRIDFAQPFYLKEYLNSFDSKCGETIVTHLGRHLVYDASHCSAVMCTQLVAFLLLNRYREGCTFNQLLSAFIRIKRECLNRHIDVGFSGEDEHVLCYALKMLHHVLVYKKDSDGMKHIYPRLDKVLSLQYYSNAVLKVFSVDAVVATCILARASLEVVSDEVMMSFDSLCEMCHSLCELLDEEFIFTRPCQLIQDSITKAISDLVTQELISFVEEGLHKTALYKLGIDDDEATDNGLKISLKQTRENLDLIGMLSSSLLPIITSYFYTVAKLTALVDNQMEEKNFVQLVQTSIKQRDLPYGECLSVEPIQKAVRSLKTKGVLESVRQNNIELLYLVEDYDDYSRVAEILAHITQFIIK